MLKLNTNSPKINLTEKDFYSHPDKLFSTIRVNVIEDMVENLKKVNTTDVSINEKHLVSISRNPSTGMFYATGLKENKKTEFRSEQEFRDFLYAQISFSYKNK